MNLVLVLEYSNHYYYGIDLSCSIVLSLVVCQATPVGAACPIAMGMGSFGFGRDVNSSH